MRTGLASIPTSAVDRPALYLDLDGVLLVQDASRHGYRVVNNAEEFLAGLRFEAHSLSSRCLNGDIEEGVPRAEDAGDFSDEQLVGVSAAHVREVDRWPCFVS